jgi:hypothetical protein
VERDSSMEGEVSMAWTDEKAGRRCAVTGPGPDGGKDHGQYATAREQKAMTGEGEANQEPGYSHGGSRSRPTATDLQDMHILHVVSSDSRSVQRVHHAVK